MKMNELSQQQLTNDEETEMAESTKLTITNNIPLDDDGIDDAADAHGGRGKPLKFNDTRKYTVGKEKTPLPEGTEMIFIGAAYAWMRLKKDEKVQFIWQQTGKPLLPLDRLPDRDERLWNLGPDGRAQDPWKPTRFAYFIDPTTGDRYEFSSTTWRGREAVTEIADQTRKARKSLKANVVPLVALRSKLKTDKYGEKLGPVFEWIKWIEREAAAAAFGAPQPAAITHNFGKPAAQQITAQPAAQPPSDHPAFADIPITDDGLLRDEIPW
jgi:hypothetical protein